MKQSLLFAFLYLAFLNSCIDKKNSESVEQAEKKDSSGVEKQAVIDTVSAEDIIIKKELLYDQHTLEDTYPYKDTTRVFQWDKIKERLAFLENMQREPADWGILQNYKNRNKEAPLVKNFHRNAYTRISDSLGTERYQSVPLYLLTDSVTPELYGRDGSLVKLLSDSADLMKVKIVDLSSEWLVPQRYIKPIGDTVSFKKAVFVDVTNQNITTLEYADSVWIVRSMNPATTGRHKPPYAQETPVGMYVVQEKRVKMVYLHDGSSEVAGYAPYASRFTNGAYIHGVPVALPRTEMIEFSPSLGTTPRSHMCVRNATSHAKFVFDWAPTFQTIVFVID
ncbi:MAG: L,D-transpeptidase [Dysgonomonas sp.]